MDFVYFVLYILQRLSVGTFILFVSLVLFFLSYRSFSLFKRRLFLLMAPGIFVFLRKAFITASFNVFKLDVFCSSFLIWVFF